MPTLTITVGLPGCGKSTWAESVVKNDRNTVIVCRDNIRESMYGSYDVYNFNKLNEKYVTETQLHQLQVLKSQKRNIIISDTNFKHIDTWRTWSKENGYTFVIKDFFDDFKQPDVPDYFSLQKYIQHCLKYNLKRLKSVPEDVIMDMSKKYILPMCTDYVTFDTDKEDAIIVDIDGTLADKGFRCPFDESKVLEDGVHSEVILSVLAESMYFKRKVIIVSGRTEACCADTKMWLLHNNIPFDELHMRQEGDSRGDDLVKYEIFNNHIRQKYNVRKVFDDRNKVVRMWRELLGLKVFQVQDGNF